MELKKIVEVRIESTTMGVMTKTSMTPGGGGRGLGERMGNEGNKGSLVQEGMMYKCGWTVKASNRQAIWIIQVRRKSPFMVVGGRGRGSLVPGLPRPVTLPSLNGDVLH